MTSKDADRGLEKASEILRTLEADGLLSVDVLDEFELSIRCGIRGLMRELRPKRLVFNDLNPSVLHGRTLRNRQAGNVVRGMFAVAMLAIEKRLTVAVRYLLIERFKEDHAAVERTMTWASTSGSLTSTAALPPLTPRTVAVPTGSSGRLN